MYTKVLALFVLANILVNGIYALPPLQLEPQIGGLPDGAIKNRVQKGSSTFARLPNDVVPSHYSVDIIPIIDQGDPDQFKKAPGNVTITVTCVKATKQIVLNTVEIDVISVKVQQGATDIPVTGGIGTADPAAQTYTIPLDTSLVEGQEYTIDINFVAQVSEDRKDGLYLSSYTDSGTKHYQAATQFEDIAARKAFPCFDEPALKAIFKFRIGRKNGFSSLWNMDSDGTPVPIDGRPEYFWDVYPEVPFKMPTYLLAIVVSDFLFDEATENLYTKPVRTWYPQNMANTDRGAFASDTAAKTLKFYDEYLDHEYDFPKMDSVAVPVFAAGAMENWGLNLYQMYYLLFTEGESTQLEKWNMASVLAHELAHQWWGNLVTMKWWNDLWLNEGFANYMQFHGANAAAPEFEPMQRVTIDTTQRALDFDAGPDSRPVHLLDLENPITPPSRIAYDKGASIIRMMNAFLTKDTLLNGLRQYLKDKSYDNAEQDELFERLTVQAHADKTLPADITVKTIMDTWTLQVGFPLIKVTRASATRVYFSQERFVNSPLVDPSGLWYVPVSYVTKANPDVTVESLKPKLWINNDVVLTSHNVETTNNWILVNPDSQSYYRVLYDNALGSQLLEQLATDHTKIPALSRGELLDDYFKSAFAGYISIQKAFEFTEYLEKETELPVWTTVFNNLRTPLTVLTESSYKDDFYAYLTEKVAARLTAIKPDPVENDTPVTHMLRAQLLDWACALGHAMCFETAAKHFATWMANPAPATNPIMADLQPMLYCAAVANQASNAADLLTFVWNKYKEATASVRQQGLLVSALACTANSEEIAKLIPMAASAGSDIKEAHAVTLLEKLAANPDARLEVWVYLRDNTKAILDSSRLGASGLTRVITALSNYFNTIEEKAALEKFLTDNDQILDADTKTSIQASINNVDANIKWLTTHGPGLTAFFASFARKLV